jgi:hypothetical protein
VHGDNFPSIAQLRDRAANSDAGDAVLVGQFGLTRQPGVRRKPPGVDVSLNVGGDLNGHGRGGVMPDPVPLENRDSADDLRIFGMSGGA